MSYPASGITTADIESWNNAAAGGLQNLLDGAGSSALHQVNSNASGNYSFAIGNQTTSSSNSAFSQGYKTKASGSYTHAEGYATCSTGYASHAEGD